MKNNSAGLTTAKVAKNDEFYTQLTDIENEMEHYWPQFKDKTIFMNCDDPKMSWFWFYFAAQFEHLGIRKLIATHYDKNNSTYKMEIEKDINGDGKIDGDDAVITPLKGNGDFRSPECVALLDESDIVITNPPFSLFREYVKQLMDHHKKFLIIGNVNAVTYKEIFPYIKNDQIWFGVTIHSGDREFGVPDSYPLTAVGTRIDGQGHKFVRVKGVRWFTNLEYKKRYEEYLLYKKYTPEEFPKYDNYDAINVNSTREIPVDYAGKMGVPITFLDKYNPHQFEILGLDRYIAGNPTPGKRFTINGSETYARIIIRHRQGYSGEE